MNASQGIAIGTQWCDRNERVYTVRHVLTTTDETGNVRDVRFECEHTFLGNVITSNDCATTVAMGMNRLARVAA